MTMNHAQISLQHDWKDILRSPGQKAWVTCSKEGQKNVYGEICISTDDTTQIRASDGIQAKLLPNVRSLDISSGGSLGVSCSEDGTLHIWQTEDGKLRRNLEEHISDVTHCRFIPSGMVVLSGGVDMRLKIWSVEDGSCPATMTGHKGAITDTCILDRGRNFISCSRDGYAKLWDCGTATCLVDLYKGNSIINACVLSTSHTWQATSQVIDRSEQECSTEGKLLILAKENGSLNGIDVYSREKVFQMDFDSAINSCCFVNEYRMVVGQQNGCLAVMDTRNTSEVAMTIKHGKSSVNCVERYFKNTFLVGRSDGSCSYLSIDGSDNNFTTRELIGPNQDPVYDISLSNLNVYTACRDGVIRKYKVDLTMA